MQRSVFGQFVSASVCPTCRGEGKIIKNPCKTCNGDGRQRGEHTLDVDIPAGVSSDNYLTMRGVGNAGPRGGPRGDVIVVIEVEEDARFIREGSDLIYDLPVSFSHAALGRRGGGAHGVRRRKGAHSRPGCRAARRSPCAAKGCRTWAAAGAATSRCACTCGRPRSSAPEQEALFRQLAELEDPVPQAGTRRGKGFWSRVRDAFAA